MKQYKYFLFLFVALALAAIACVGGGTPAPQNDLPTATPQVIVVTATPEAQEAATPKPESESGPFTNSQGLSSEVLTFTDSNNLFSFDLPGNWSYNNSFNEEDGIYVDHFESPDQSGFIENITGFSDTPLSGKLNGKIALYFIHKYYSYTGKEGDIRISSDQIQPDGSERLEWESKGGKYYGMSYFEVRGEDRKTFLMFTVWWSDSTPQEVMDSIENAIKTYRIP